MDEMDDCPLIIFSYICLKIKKSPTYLHDYDFFHIFAMS